MSDFDFQNFESILNQIDHIDEDGCTPLHRAVKLPYVRMRNVTKEKHQQTVKQLLDYDVINIDAQDNEGNTALHYAVRNGYGNIVVLLLEYRAEINIKNNYSSTPLHIAAEYRFPPRWWNNLCSEIPVILVQNNADVNAMDCEQRTPLIVFFGNGASDSELSQKLVRLLLSKNCNTSSVTRMMLCTKPLIRGIFHDYYTSMVTRFKIFIKKTEQAYDYDILREILFKLVPRHLIKYLQVPIPAFVT